MMEQMIAPVLPLLSGADSPALPLPRWAQGEPASTLWYALSRVGDHGRLPPFRHLTQLTQHVFMGGQIDRRGWRIMQGWGVGAIVSLRIEWDDRRFGIDTPNYLWLPTIDGTAPSVEQMARGALFTREHVLAGRGVYIHCAGGLGRAPSQAIAYLMLAGMEIESAIAFVQAHRPFIHLSRWQRARLDEFAVYMKQRPALLSPAVP